MICISGYLRVLSIFDYSDLGSISEVLSDDFWRIAVTGRASDCLLISGKVLRHLDTRVSPAFSGACTLIQQLVQADEKYSDLFSAVSPSESLTAIEPLDGHLIRLCSTSQLLWIDDRSPAKPLLGYQHYRQYDRTLGTRTLRIGTGIISVARGYKLLMPHSKDPLTFLTSLKSGMVNIYDVSRTHDDAPLRVNYLPYNLSSASPDDGVMRGQTFVQSPSMDSAISLFRISEGGSIHRVSCTTSGTHERTLGTHQWSQSVARLDEKAATLSAQVGPLGQRDYIEEDLSGLYARRL